MEEEKLRAVYYARCSTEEENQKDALVRQAAEAEEAIRARGWRLVDAYVESRSGTSRKGRWEYNRLYEDLEQNRFDVVVIKSQDRLMRNTRDWYLFADRLNCAGKRLYFYLENTFYSPEDALLTGIKAILAEEYSRELSKKMNLAHQKRQQNNGDHPGGGRSEAPYVRTLCRRSRRTENCGGSGSGRRPQPRRKTILWNRHYPHGAESHE